MDDSPSRNKKYNNDVFSCDKVTSNSSKYDPDNPERNSSKDKDQNDPDIPDNSMGDYYCKYCDVHTNSENMWQNHINGRKHLKNIKNPVDDVLDKVKTEVIDDKPLIIQQLNKITSPIVGLNYTCELRKSNMKQIYNCYLCGVCSLTYDLFKDHLLSVKHKLAHIKKEDPKQYQLIDNLNLNKRDLESILTDYACQFETKHGRGEMQVKKQKEQTDKNLNYQKWRPYEHTINGSGSYKESHKSRRSTYSPQKKHRQNSYDESFSWTPITDYKRKHYDSDNDSYENEHKKFSKFDKRYCDKEQSNYNLNSSLRLQNEMNNERYSGERKNEPFCSNTTFFEQKKYISNTYDESSLLSPITNCERKLHDSDTESNGNEPKKFSKHDISYYSPQQHNYNLNSSLRPLNEMNNERYSGEQINNPSCSNTTFFEQKKYMPNTYDENSLLSPIANCERRLYGSDTECYENAPKKFSKHSMSYNTQQCNYNLNSSLRPLNDMNERYSGERINEPSCSNTTFFDQKIDKDIALLSNEEFLNTFLLKMKALQIKNRKEADIASQLWGEITKRVMEYVLQASPPEKQEKFKTIYANLEFNLLDKILIMLPQKTCENGAEIVNYQASQSSSQTSIGLCPYRDNATGNRFSQPAHQSTNYFSKDLKSDY